MSMKIIICLFVIVSSALSLWAWELSKDTQEVNHQIAMMQKEIGTIELESKGLASYKTKASTKLSEFYLDVFNDIREICSYYNAEPAVKIAGGIDGRNIEEFFIPSQYKGVRCVDLLIRINPNQAAVARLLSLFYEMAQTLPIQIQEIKIEKNIVDLTMRLYGL